MLEKKIKSQAQLKKIISALQKKGRRVVFTNGCFDLLHAGHVEYLQEAKRKGDILVVAVNSDSSVRRLKGNKRPIVKAQDRTKVIAALESVDYVVVFAEDNPEKLIRFLRPDILVKGADWNQKDIVGSDLVLGYGGKVHRINFLKGRSSSNLIKKIAQNL